MDNFKILIADDDKLIRWSMGKELSKRGYKVIQTKNGKEAVERFSGNHFDLVLLDYMMPEMDGLDALSEIKKIRSDSSVIMLTAVNDAEVAVKAMKNGAFDYIIKTLNFEQVCLSIDRVIEAILSRQVSGKKYGVDNCPSGIIYRSEKMNHMMEIVAQLMASNATTLLLQGESGTGKNLIAKAIHTGSDRREKLFVEVDCGSLPDHLIESELFGHEKGAFTDAKLQKKGLAEIADGGTVFLDEIGELPMNMQVKLLKFIEERKFRRVGGLKDIHVDVRFIAASNKNLASAVKNNEFRMDLFYRLNVVKVQIPPLRERKEDVIPLIRHFMSIFNRQFGKSILDIPEELEHALQCYAWPGNIRELKNVVERGILMSSGSSLNRNFIFDEMDSTESSKNQEALVCSFVESGISLEEVESNLLAHALQFAGGNQSKAARMLKIGRDSLRRKMKKHGFAENPLPPESLIRMTGS